MSSYMTTLPQVFTHALEVDRTELETILDCLNRHERGFSSYAVTADTHNSDKARLWLSQTSMGRLKAAGFVA